MKHTRIIALGVLLTSVSVTGLHAQSLSDNPVPAEFPPSSFSGGQYVDSAGCVFIRAGIDGNTTWVPRVTRDRRQICGQQPTFAAAPAQAEPVQTTQAEPAPAPVQVAEPVQTAPVRTQSSSAQQATQDPLPTVATTITQPSTSAAQPVATVTAVPPTTTATTTTTTTTTSTTASTTANTFVPVSPEAGGAGTASVRQSACPNASELSQRFTNSGERHPVRCGPQAEPSFGPIRTAGAGGGQAGQGSGGGPRLLPAHLVEERSALNVIRVPEGFEPVWDDGRLNPRRAEQTADGFVQSQNAVTLTVPRRPVGGSGPNRVVQPRILSQEAVRTARVRVEYGSAAGEAAKAERAPAARDEVFVRVGVFADETQARAGAQRMARTGIPTRMAKIVRGDKAMPMVVAGPFASREAAEKAANTARGVGFARASVLN